MLGGDLTGGLDAAGQEVGQVPVEVAPVGRQGVAGQPALDLEVLEVAAQVPAERAAGPGGGALRRGPGRRPCAWAQDSTSSRAVLAMPTASPTGALVSCPAWVLRPRASDRSLRQACSQPLFATATAYGRVAFVRA